MWTLVTEGVPGDAIQIEVIYNNNLKAELFNDEKTVVSKTLPTDKPVMFYTKLATDTAEAEKLEYYGFDAELAVLNDLEEEIDRVPMAVGMECFEAGVTLEPGEYYFVTTVTGPNLSLTQPRPHRRARSKRRCSSGRLRAANGLRMWARLSKTKKIPC